MDVKTIPAPQKNQPHKDHIPTSELQPNPNNFLQKNNKKKI